MLTLGTTAGSVGFFATARMGLTVPERVTAGATGTTFSLALTAAVRLGREDFESSTPELS